MGTMSRRSGVTGGDPEAAIVLFSCSEMSGQTACKDYVSGQVSNGSE